jgi:hypothetical protein
MNTQVGFRVTATPANGRHDDAKVENFEVRQAAIDCAQLLDARGWKDIRCQHITSRVKQFDFDSSEELKDVEWQCHLIGGTA